MYMYNVHARRPRDFQRAEKFHEGNLEGRLDVQGLRNVMRLDWKTLNRENQLECIRQSIRV